MQRLGFVRFHQVRVQISNDNYIIEMNMNFINTRSKIVKIKLALGIEGGR